MKTHYILVIYPGMYSKQFTIKGEIHQSKDGFYRILTDDGEVYYFPAALTIITTKPNVLWALPSDKKSSDG